MKERGSLFWTDHLTRKSRMRNCLLPSITDYGGTDADDGEGIGGGDRRPLSVEEVWSRYCLSPLSLSLSALVQWVLLEGDGPFDITDFNITDSDITNLI